MVMQNQAETFVDRVAAQTPPRLARRARGLSDRFIAWLFIAPTIALLLAINIFPLIWAIRLSFTNYKSNLGHVPIRFVGLANYIDILTDEDVWHGMQVTARFVVSSIALQVFIGFGLALADQPRIPVAWLLDHGDSGADDVVARGRRELLDAAVPASDRALSIT